MCKKHPKYKVIRVPKVDCEDCWRLYKAKYGENKAIEAYLKFMRNLTK